MQFKAIHLKGIFMGIFMKNTFMSMELPQSVDLHVGGEVNLRNCAVPSSSVLNFGTQVTSQCRPFMRQDAIICFE